MPRVAKLFIVVATLTSCAYHNPAQPTSPVISESTPAFLTLGVPTATTVSAYVQNERGAPLSGVVVQFASNVGTVSPASVATAANGRAETTVTASGDARITATAGALTARALVAAPVTPTPNPTPTPTPSPGPSPTPAPPAASVFLNVSTSATTGVPLVFGVSSAATGVTWQWTFGDGVTDQTTAFSTSHTYGAAGSYTATVTGAGLPSSSATITVSAPVLPTPPVASYTVTLAASPTTVVQNSSSTTLTATVAASNGALAPTNYAWDCDNNGTIDANTAGNTYALCVFPTAGTTTAKVTVTATGSTVTGSATTTVTVTALAAPVVTVSCNTGVHVTPAVSSCAVSATRNGVAIPSGMIGPVTWDFGDGGTGSSPSNISLGHSYTLALTYTVVATASFTGITGPTSGSTTTTILP